MSLFHGKIKLAKIPEIVFLCEDYVIFMTRTDDKNEFIKFIDMMKKYADCINNFATSMEANLNLIDNIVLICKILMRPFTVENGLVKNVSAVVNRIMDLTMYNRKKAQFDIMFSPYYGLARLPLGLKENEVAEVLTILNDNVEIVRDEYLENSAETKKNQEQTITKFLDENYDKLSDDKQTFAIISEIAKENGINFGPVKSMKNINLITPPI